MEPGHEIGHGHESGPDSTTAGYESGAGQKREEEKESACLVTMLSSKQLDELRSDLVELTKENTELKHQIGVIEEKLADAQFHRRLYWNCGVAWARTELQWINEREMLERRIAEVGRTRWTGSDDGGHSLDQDGN